MKRLTYILLFGAILLSGCSKLADDQDKRISLGIGIGNIDAATKTAANANEFNQSMISSDKKFVPALWFTTSTEKMFQKDIETVADMFPCRTTVEFENTSPKYVKHNGADLIYPTMGENTPVYCVGLYPSTGWYSEDGINAHHNINGSDDLMFAPLIEGSWTNRFGIQTYNHLLTWIKINVCATTLETARQWGSVSKVEIETGDKVVVNLQTGAKSYSHPVVPAEGEDSYYYIKGFDNAAGLDLSLTSTPVASVFCSPATSYNIKITMKDGISKTVNVPLKNLDGTNLTTAENSIGKLYIINLYFKPFDIIEGKSSLYYWNNKNEDLYLQ